MTSIRYELSNEPHLNRFIEFSQLNNFCVELTLLTQRRPDSNTFIFFSVITNFTWYVWRSTQLSSKRVLQVADLLLSYSSTRIDFSVYAFDVFLTSDPSLLVKLTICPQEHLQTKEKAKVGDKFFNQRLNSAQIITFHLSHSLVLHIN